MKKLNLNQRKGLSDILINLLTVLISAFIVSKILYENKFDFYSVIAAAISLIVSVALAFVSINIVK